jgi:hypothetical protein
MPITVRGLIVDRVESQEQLDQTRNPEAYARYLMESMARALAERLVADGLVRIETTQNVVDRTVQFRMSLKVGLPRDARPMPTDRIYLDDDTARNFRARPDPGVRATASGTLFAPDSGASMAERYAIERVMSQRERDRRAAIRDQAEAAQRHAISVAETNLRQRMLAMGPITASEASLPGLFGLMASGIVSAPPDPPAIDPEV